LIGKRERNMNGRSVKISNMKHGERKMRPNKSGEKKINMHEITYDIRTACKRFLFISEFKLRIMN